MEKLTNEFGELNKLKDELDELMGKFDELKDEFDELDMLNNKFSVG